MRAFGDGGVSSSFNRNAASLLDKWITRSRSITRCASVSAA